MGTANPGHSGVLTTALLAGAGAARVVESVKELLPVIPPPAAKSAFATVVAAALAATLASGDWRPRIIAAVGAAGVAMVVHEATSLLSVVSDRQKVIVMRAASQR